MLRKEGYLAGYVSIIALALFFAFPVVQARASSLYFSPSSVSQNVGQTFSVSVRINTEGHAINAGQGSIIFDKEKLEVVFISKTGSIFNLWTQEPVFSNSEGTINFEGGIPNPGYNGSSGLVLTATFKTKTSTTVRETTSVTLVSGALLANDGQGTNVLTSLGSLIVSINPIVDTNTQPKVTPEITPKVTPEVVVSGAPKVESSTHSDSTKWYSNNSPTFTWTLPSNATGVSYLITDKATSNPGPASDGVVSKATFTGISDGTQYLNIKFKQGSVWGPIAHYQFNIDTVAPAGFEIHSIIAEDIQPQITFETTDALSGIDHYEVKVGDTSNWITVPADQAGKPYRLSFDKIGTQTVYVKAVDRAGNATTESISLTVTSTAVGSTVGSWVAKLFDGIVNALSNYGLLIILLVGILILIYKLLGAGIDKLWHRWENHRVIRKTERKIDKKFDRILNDMKEEIKFLETISKHRPLGFEEKYLKSKLQQYIKDLKNSGR